MKFFRDPSSVSGLSCFLLLSAAFLAGGCQEPEIEKDPGVWAQFRGPDNMGIAAASELPSHWTLERGIRWKTLLPDGISQPIVSGDRIFLAAGKQIEEKTHSRRVIGLDAATGETLWETDIFTGPREKLHYKFSSVAMASPATDGETVFAYFGPRLAALDRNGEVLWNEVVDERYWKESRYGAATSPVLVDDKVLIFRDLENAATSDDPKSSWIAAHSKQDGSLLWKAEWFGTCCSYATPTIAERPDGTKQILITSSPFVMGFDLETGAELWRIDYPSVQVVPSSSLVGDLFIASGAVHDRLTAGFRLTGSGTEAGIEELWRVEKAVPEIASPVVYNGILFQVTEAGVASAIDAESGNAMRRWRLPPGPYRASMIAGNGRIYATSARGTVSIWHADPNLGFEMLGTLPLPTDTGPYLSMAAAEDCLLLRARYALYCIDGFEPEPTSDGDPPAEEPAPSEEA